MEGVVIGGGRVCTLRKSRKQTLFKEHLTVCLPLFELKPLMICSTLSCKLNIISGTGFMDHFQMDFS